MNITPADLIRGAMTLKDEATLLGLNLAKSSAPSLSFGMQHTQGRREALARCADYLEQQAKALQAGAA